MKAKLLTLILSLSALTSAQSATIVQWNFNSPVPDDATSTGTLNPATGTGAASYFGGVTNSSSGQFVTGDTTADPAGTNDNSAWATSRYPIATTNTVAGVRFDASTLGYENVVVTWFQRNSATASRYWRLQYTLDGTAFQTANGYAVSPDSVFINQSADLSAITGAANNPAFGFRIVPEWESTATGSGTNAFVATNPSNTYNGSSGTVRFDMVTVSGTAIPGGNTPPQISSLSDQTLRVNQCSAALALTVADTEDAPDSLMLSASSSNPAVVPEAGIVFGGAGGDRTVTLSASEQVGESVVTLTVTDSGGRFDSTSFNVTVLPRNTAPFISGLPHTNTLVNTPTAPLSFVVGDLESAPGELEVSGVSANPALLPNTPANITFGGSGSSRTVTLTTAPGQTGVATVALTVTDGTNTADTVFSLMVTRTAATILCEPFDYSNGSLLTNSAFRWANRSGTEGQCQVIGGQLQIAADQTEDVVAPLIGGPYNTGTQNVLYAAFKVKFLNLPKSTPGLFSHFANGSTLRGRIYAGTTNATPNHFRIQTANGAGAVTELPTDLRTNATYSLVTRYDLDNASTTLWLDPTAETDPGVSATDTQTAARIASYGFRQDSDVGATLLIDDLKVGLTFASVVGNSSSPTPIPLTIQRNGSTITLLWTDPAFALQSAPALDGAFTNIDGAVSPYTTPTSGSARFFRLKAN